MAILYGNVILIIGVHKGHISMLGSSKPLFTKPSDFLLFFRFILWIWVFWTQIQIYRQNQNLWIFFKYIIWSKTINLEMSKIDSLEICISNVLWHIFQACGSSGPLLRALGLIFIQFTQFLDWNLNSMWSLHLNQKNLLVTLRGRPIVNN